MSIEEKAKAYDEALERARQIKNGENGWKYSDLVEITPALEEVFPQLHEGDDEKIRTLLIALVQWAKTFNQSGLDPNTVNRMLSYLEKQKEQKPVMIQWTGKNLKEVIDFTGKSQKFGEWFKSWEDYENYVHSHGDIFKLFCEDGSHYEVPVGAWIVKTPDGYNIPSRFRFIQKPAEWNEEDEKMRTNAILSLQYLIEESPNTGFIDSVKKEIAWLKSPRPSWKPSKEQMEALETAERWYSDNMGCNLALVSLCEQLKKLM